MHAGGDNQNVCPPIMGYYTHWTFWGLFHASSSALFPALYVVFYDTAHIMCPKCGVYRCAVHASCFCPSEILVALRNRRVQFTPTLACIALAFSFGDQLVIDKPPSVNEVRPKVLIRGQEFFVPQHYPKDASGKLEYNKNQIKELEQKTTGALRNICKHNPPSAQPTYKDKKADLIYKRVFCDFT